MSLKESKHSNYDCTVDHFFNTFMSTFARVCPSFERFLSFLKPKTSAANFSKMLLQIFLFKKRILIKVAVLYEHEPL